MMFSYLTGTDPPSSVVTYGNLLDVNPGVTVCWMEFIGRPDESRNRPNETWATIFRGTTNRGVEFTER